MVIKNCSYGNFHRHRIFRHVRKGWWVLIEIKGADGTVVVSDKAPFTAVVGITKSAAFDYAPYKVTVNAICLSYTETSIFVGTPEQAKQYFINDCPSGRMGKAEECAYLTLFLASDMARYITVAAIPVDGGLSAGSKNVSTWKSEILDIR